MNKITYMLYLFFYDQAGFTSIRFWQEVTMDEIDAITEKYGSLEDAAFEDTKPNERFWVVTDTDLEHMRNKINEVLK